MLATRPWSNLGAAVATRLQLCGTIVLRIDGRRIEGELPGRLGRLLAVHLARTDERVVRVTELLAALWPDEPPAAAEASLSPLLSKVRRAVGHDLIAGRGACGCDSPPAPGSTARRPLKGIHRAESASVATRLGRRLCPGRSRSTSPCVGFSRRRCPWVDEIRHHLEELHVRALELVGEACPEIGGSELNTRRALRPSPRRDAPYRESGHRMLMCAHGGARQPREACSSTTLSVQASRRPRRRAQRGDAGTAPQAARRVASPTR